MNTEPALVLPSIFSLLCHTHLTDNIWMPCPASAAMNPPLPANWQRHLISLLASLPCPAMVIPLTTQPILTSTSVVQMQTTMSGFVLHPPPVHPLVLLPPVPTRTEINVKPTQVFIQPACLTYSKITQSYNPGKLDQLMLLFLLLCCAMIP